MTTLLLVDSNYICHRSWHTTGQLTHEGEATGVAFGFLRELDSLVDMFNPDTVIFAFDCDPLIRYEIYPEYKFTRKNKVRSEEEKISYALFKTQVQKLKNEIIPALGYNNIYAEIGYEADDIIAYFCERLPIGDDAIIVSADQDLWQCLTDKIICYNPSSNAKNKLITEAFFRQKYKIEPALWASVKAIAGCKTDDIKGIEGIGDITAAKWFSGDLKEGSKKYQAIHDNLDIHNINIKLTRLPLDGLKLVGLQPDDATESKKTKVQVDLGIRNRRQTRRKPQVIGFKGFDI